MKLLKQEPTTGNCSAWTGKVKDYNMCMSVADPEMRRGGFQWRAKCADFLATPLFAGPYDVFFTYLARTCGWQLLLLLYY